MFLHQLLLETGAPVQKIFLNIFNALLHENGRGILSSQKVKLKQLLSLLKVGDTQE